MKTYSIAVNTLVITLLCAACGSSTATKTETPTSGNSSLDALSARIAALENNVSALSQQVNTLTTSNDASDHTLSNQVAQLQSQISALGTTDAGTGNLAAQIATLANTVNQQGTQLTQQTSDLNQLGSEFTNLSQTVATQGASISALNGVGARVSAVESKTASLSTATLDGHPALVVSGVNLYVQNGASGQNNGLGNLVVGYNLSRTPTGHPDLRTGTHNLVVGDQNNYTSQNGVVFGFSNSINSYYSTILGGDVNTTNAQMSTVVAGHANTTEITCVIGGGVANACFGPHSVVSGGYRRSAQLQYGWVAGTGAEQAN